VHTPRLPRVRGLLCAGVGRVLLRWWNCRRCGSGRPQAGNGPTRFRRSPGAGLVDHPLEETAHRDAEACRLGLDPGASVVVEADAYNGGLGGRHDPVNSNPGCLHQRRRMVAARWWATRQGSEPDWLRHASAADPGRLSTSPTLGRCRTFDEPCPGCRQIRMPGGIRTLGVGGSGTEPPLRRRRSERIDHHAARHHVGPRSRGASRCV
jgi:hypothetical protein